MGDVIDGPRTWTGAIRERGVAEVIGLFGARDVHNAKPVRSPELAAAMAAAREADTRIKTAAARIRAMIAPQHVDPSLLLAFAARIEMAARTHRDLCDEAASLGLADERATHENIAEILETRAAILEASLEP